MTSPLEGVTRSEIPLIIYSTEEMGLLGERWKGHSLEPQKHKPVGERSIHTK